MTGPAKTPAVERVDVKTHRTVKVLGTDDRPALELTNVQSEITVALLPRNGGRRAPVRLADLKRAVDALAGS